MASLDQQHYFPCKLARGDDALFSEALGEPSFDLGLVAVRCRPRGMAGGGCILHRSPSETGSLPSALFGPIRKSGEQAVDYGYRIAARALGPCPDARKR